MIEVKNVNKAFGGKEVLSNVSSKFEQGKVNMIIGQSGSGKSVLAKCIVGLHEVDYGQILFDRKDFSSINRQQRTEIRKEIGMLFQGSALFDSMTVEENVMFPLTMFTKKPKNEMLDRVNFCLERVNLNGKNNLYPAECSGGMQKRGGIARASVLNPSYLFCDEPNSGLDPKTSLVIDELIKDITIENNMTTIINTHDMNSVMEIGDNVVLLHEGEICWQGNKDEIMASDNEILHDFIFASPFLQRLRNAAVSNGFHI